MLLKHSHTTAHLLKRAKYYPNYLPILPFENEIAPPTSIKPPMTTMKPRRTKSQHVQDLVHPVLVLPLQGPLQGAVGARAGATGAGLTFPAEVGVLEGGLVSPLKGILIFMVVWWV